MNEIEQRPGESRNTFRKRRWRTIKRTQNGEGMIVSRVQIPVRKGDRPRPLNPSLARVSTLYDAAGEVRAQWQIEKPEDRKRALWMQEALEVLSQRLEPLPPILLSSHLTERSRLSVYPIGDHHIGMLSWKPETGAHYDLAIAEHLLREAFRELTARMPATSECLIIDLGDFLHYDSQKPVTVKGEHSLDSDGRFQKMIRVGLRCLVGAIEACLAKHETVNVIIEPGNHDPYSSPWLAEALSLRYFDNPRVTIDTSPTKFHYYRFGNCLLGTHHGDTIRDPGKLSGIMAQDRAKDWGDTQHRYWLTGHVHTQKKFYYPGCSVESFNILAPGDSWSTSSGYRARREMQAIVYDEQHGEITRQLVKPEMLS